MHIHTVSALVLVSASCRGGRTEIPRASPAGECSVTEAEVPAERGVAAYTEHVTPTAGGGFHVGSLGVTITCLTGGAARDLVVLVLPNLTRGERPRPGNYVVRVPGDTALTREESLDPRLAWARVARGVDAPVLYRRAPVRWRSRGRRTGCWRGPTRSRSRPRTA